MNFFKKKLPVEIQLNEAKAEKLKKQVIAPHQQLERDARHLNELLLADGITLKIYYATGGDLRSKRA